MTTHQVCSDCGAVLPQSWTFATYDERRICFACIQLGIEAAVVTETGVDTVRIEHILHTLFHDKTPSAACRFCGNDGPVAYA